VLGHRVGARVDLSARAGLIQMGLTYL
jgi:hypothetical protein